MLEGFDNLLTVLVTSEVLTGLVLYLHPETQRHQDFWC